MSAFKIHFLVSILIIYFSCNIISQEKNTAPDTNITDMGSTIAAKTTDGISGKDTLTANDIIIKARNFNLKSSKILKSYNLHVFSQSLVKYHLINNPIDFFTDYDGTDYNFLGADESEQFQYYKTKENDKDKKIIVESHRQTDMLDKMSTSYFYPNYFNEEMSVINEKLPGPLAPDCFENYKYKLLGVSDSSGKKIYKIGIKERFKYIPSFYGTIYIEDGTFALKEVSLKTNLAINIPMVKEISLNNKFDTYIDSTSQQLFSMPVSSELKATASVAGAVKLILDSYYETRNVIINSNQKNIKYDDFEVVVKPDAQKKSDEFWEKNGIKSKDTLVSAEFEKMKSSAYKSKSFVKYTGTGLKFGNSLTWNFLYSYTFNRIDGNHIELNTTYERNFKRFLLDSRFIYGTASRQLNYSFNLALLPTKKLDVKLKAEVFSDLGHLFKKLGWINYIENAISTLITRKDRVDYYKKEGYRLGADYRISGFLTVGADFYQERQMSVSNNTNFSFVKKDENYSINPTINDGILRKVSLNLYVDFNRYRMVDWGDGDVSRIRLSILPVMEFRYGLSDRKFIKSTYDIKEYHVKVTGSVLLGSAFKLIYKGGATLKYGKVPYQELLAVDPKFLGLPNDVSMITPDYSEFLGDRIVFMNFENEFGKIFPFNIPILSSITLLGDLCFGKTWITDDNRKLSADKNYKSTVGFFTEIGFGLTRILEICTLRYSIRLNNKKPGSDSFLFFDVGIRY